MTHQEDSVEHEQDASRNIDGNELDLAIVGMAARLPGAATMDRYWENLANGVESITRLGDDELLAAGVSPELLADPSYVRASVILEGMEWFDPGFFGMSPRDGAMMDPQHRLFLEVGWHALEDAGHDPAAFDGRIGVFGGSGYNAYMTYNLLTNPEVLAASGFFLLRHAGNDKDFLCTRLSYALDLRGPSVNVQTACSTSLVAVHMACQSLLNRECDMALAGGVTIELPHRQGYVYRPSEIFSPDGHCRAFDADSQGTVFGSGAGMVVIRRLSDALRDGDNIRAIIKASCINNDGSGKAGYLAPSVDGQAAAIAEALALADIDPETVTYVEAHGTATPVGDPIEIAALTQAYGARASRRQFCAIGSVKTNIGHLDTAAGVAGLMKTVLALQHRKIPPSLHYSAPNPRIDFENSPFYVNARLAEWPTQGAPRRAGVSSLGVGGTNAHVILEEAPVPGSERSGRALQILVLSARDQTALDAAADNAISYSQANPHANFADVAYTYQMGRRAFGERRAVVADSLAEAARILDGQGESAVLKGSSGDQAPRVVFMFTGQGAQFVGMGRDLYQREPGYREHFDRCCDLLLPLLGVDLRSVVFAEADDARAAAFLQQTSIAQPALFALQYSLARLWLSWGIRPEAMIGHSIGEYAAACVAGVFSVESALALVATRGRLMQSAPPGAMLAVMCGESELLPLLGQNVELAAVNAPGVCVASGDFAAIDELAARLDGSGIAHRRLHTSHAFHSRSMDGILAEFKQAVAAANPQPPEVPFISNLSGDWIAASQACDPAYWAAHLRQCVRFADGVGTLLKTDDRLLLEVGPGRTLSQMAQQHGGRNPSHRFLHSQPGAGDQEPGLRRLYETLAQAWCHGIVVDWAAFHRGERRRRVALPGYQFTRQKLWIEPGATSHQVPARTATDARLPIGEWLHGVRWSAVTLAAHAGLADVTSMVVIGEDRALGERVSARLRAGAAVQCIDGVAALEGALAALAADGKSPRLIVHCLDSAATDHRAFDGPLQAIQTIAQSDCEAPRVVFVSRGAQAVLGEASVAPRAALALGPALVAPLELPDLDALAIDLPAGEVSDLTLEQLAKALVAEVPERLLALRDGHCYVRRFEPLAAATAQRDVRPRAGAAYLVTGGLEGIGYALAQWLAAREKVVLTLAGRTRLPPEQEWDAWLARHATDDSISRKILRIRALQANGAEVHYRSLDIGDAEAVARLVAPLGGLRGVIHAAGAVSDGPLLGKSVAAAESVLSAKVTGTLALAAATAAHDLDFFVTCSSVSSLRGVPGQVDYVAANAFLDAFAGAESRARRLNINWSAWRETGMAARLVSDHAAPPSQLAHPLVDRRLRAGADGEVFSSMLGPASHWVLDEHRVVTGAAVLPGTAFMEMVRACYEPLLTSTAIELRDVMFLSAFVVRDEQPRELRVQLQPWSRGTTFDVMSQADADDPDTWYSHLRGRINRIDAPAPATQSLAQLRQQCGPLVQHLNEQEAFLKFGDRWKCIRSLHRGQGQALLELHLPETFGADLADYVGHPALLDVATAGVLSLIDGYAPGRDFYVPIAYARIAFHAPMPAHVFSHVRFRAEDSSAGDIAVFDVRIMDAGGRVLVEFDEFMLKRLADASTLAHGTPVPTSRAVPLAVTSAMAAAPQGLKARLDTYGITDDEGRAVFEAALSGATAQVVVSPQAVEQALAELATPQAQQARTGQTAKLNLDTGPVEESLRQHPAVAEAAVVASESRLGVVQVAAFVVKRPGHSVTVSELRRHVRAQHRDELVPSMIIERDEMPRTAKGKIDYRALPDPFRADDGYVAPSTPTEQLIAGVWQDVLGIDRISITDNFFDLGGHSLLAIRVITTVKKLTGLRLEDVMLVVNTLEQTAAEMDRRTRGEATDEKPAARKSLGQRLLQAVTRGK